MQMFQGGSIYKGKNKVSKVLYLLSVVPRNLFSLCFPPVFSNLRRCGVSSIVFFVFNIFYFFQDSVEVQRKRIGQFLKGRNV